MATPPTALARPASASASEPASIQFPTGPLIVAVVAGAMMAALVTGGGSYYLMSRSIIRPASYVPKAVLSSSIPTHLLVLDPLLVNLADTDRSAYVRVSVVLKVAGVPDVKSEKKSTSGDSAEGDSVAAVRDTALLVLGRQTSEDLLKVDGKENLKRELKEGFAKHNPEIRVEDIFFTDFLVQH